MAEYPGTENERRFAYPALVDAVAAIFAGCGMSTDDARLLADSLATADLRGIHSHGVMRVPDYVDKLTVGGVDPRGRPRVLRERLGAITVDASNAMGQIAAAFAMGLAIERARQTGIACSNRWTAWWRRAPVWSCSSSTTSSGWTPPGSSSSLT